MQQINLSGRDVVVHEQSVGGGVEGLARRTLVVAEFFHDHRRVFRAKRFVRINVLKRQCLSYGSGGGFGGKRGGPEKPVRGGRGWFRNRAGRRCQARWRGLMERGQKQSYQSQQAHADDCNQDASTIHANLQKGSMNDSCRERKNSTAK